MVRRLAPYFLLALGVTPLSPALAICSYGGRLNATTTLAEEFKDSQWVVRARLLSAFDNWHRPEVKQGLEAPWTIYRLQTVRAYKGGPPRIFTFFTERNSGGFYMDRPWAGPDIGGEYLLFLNPIQAHPEMPAEARGAAFVNYSCGQSRPWLEVGLGDRERLERLTTSG